MKEYGLILLIALMGILIYTGHLIGFAEGKKVGYAIGLTDGRNQMKNEQAKAEAFLRVISNEYKHIDSCKLYEKERA